MPSQRFGPGWKRFCECKDRLQAMRHPRGPVQDESIHRPKPQHHQQRQSDQARLVKFHRVRMRHRYENAKALDCRRPQSSSVRNPGPPSPRSYIQGVCLHAKNEQNWCLCQALLRYEHNEFPRFLTSASDPSNPMILLSLKLTNRTSSISRA